MRNIGKCITCLQQSDPTVFFQINYLGMPIGQGVASGSVFGLNLAEQVTIQVFRFIKGNLMRDHINGEMPLSSKRIQIAKQLLEMLCSFQKVGLVENDLYPENFIIDSNGRVLVMDLEGAGIKAKHGSDWELKPRFFSKDYWFPLPPEVQIQNGMPIGTPEEGTDIWIGAALIFWTLTGYHPFSFLKRADSICLTYLRENGNAISCWPPTLIRPRSFKDIFENPRFSMEDMRKLIDLQFKDTNIGRLLYETYITNYNNPKLRPKFSQFREGLRSIL
jgi:serine/threonine protein kinase